MAATETAGASRSPGGTPARGSVSTPSGDSLGSVREALSKLNRFQDLAPDALVDLAEKAGKGLNSQDARGRQEKMSRTQIRKFHGHLVKQLLRARVKGDEVAREIRLLEYHLIYAVSREKKMQAFADLFQIGLHKVSSLADLERFKQFFDATLAYHVYYYGPLSD